MVSCTHFCPHDLCDSGGQCGRKAWITRCNYSQSIPPKSNVSKPTWNLKYMNCIDSHYYGCYDDGCGAKSWLRCKSSTPRRELISRPSPITGVACKTYNFKYLGCGDGGCGQKSFLTQCASGKPARRPRSQGASKMWDLKYEDGRDGGCGQKSWIARCVSGCPREELNYRVSLLRFPLRRETQPTYRFP